jgi:ribosomal protein S18 acetylase RimI-like enzyme
MEVKYREMEPSDRDQVIECLVDLVRVVAKRNPLRLDEPAPGYGLSYFERMYQYVQRGAGVIIVAESEDKIIGCVVGIVLEQSVQDLLEYKKVKQGHIPDLYVKEGFRNMGIGKTLVDLAEKYLKKQGCTICSLSVLAEYEAHELYLKLGYQDYHLEMLKSL